MTDNRFDVIIVGSGTCGATLARELTRRHSKVLVLEQGSDRSVKDTIPGMLAVSKVFTVGQDLQTMTAATVGGSTSVYFGVCELPTAETFASLGLDLSAELAETRRELPMAELPDEFLQPQSKLVQDSARELGYRFRKHLMLVDQSKCAAGIYSHQARWKARSYLDEALARGATLMTRSVVQKIIVENGRAVGVEYKQKDGIRPARVLTAYARRVVLCAGALATPKLLIDSGVENVGNRGFFLKPSTMVYGIVPGLKGRDAFIGSSNLDLGNGISIGDAAMNASLFKLFMLVNRKWQHVFAHARAIAVGIQVNDDMGGTIDAAGRYCKQFTSEELEKLRVGQRIAVSILERAGAMGISDTKLAAGIPGGALRIREHLDENMQTKVANLYVCDHSLMSDVRITPTVTLICLAKRLAKHLAPAVQSVRPPSQGRVALPA